MSLHPTRILDGLRASYWFVPSCMVVLAVGLAILMPWLDSRHAVDLSGPLGWIGQTQTDGARTVLGAIAGSIIGVAGTTFSITMVAVSFASSNFGPRLVSNFMRDRGNQVTLGTFISTFVYCLLVLRRVHGSAADGAEASYEAFVPHLSVILALVLALASVGVLIYFIHHVPETIDVDRLVASIGRELRSAVAAPFPRPAQLRPESAADAEGGAGNGAGAGAPGGSSPLPAPSSGPSPSWEERTEGRTRTRVTLGTTGYLQTLELERLVELADEHGLQARVRYRPGNFVIDSDAVLDLASDGPPDESLVDALRDCFAVGRRRTAQQNEVFLVEQLVEVIGRALSPGVNDPFTAVACFDWIKSALVELVARDTRNEPPLPTDPVELDRIEFERFVAVIFDQTRQYVCTDRNVALHVLDVLVEVAVVATRAEYRAALVRRMDELLAASREAMSGPEGADDVAAHHAQGTNLLSDPGALEAARRDHGRLDENP